MRTLFFDVTEISRLNRKTGIQRVTYEIFRSLASILPLHGFVIIPVIGNMRDGGFYTAIEFNGDFSIDGKNTSMIAAKEFDVFLGVDLNYKINSQLIKTLLSYRQRGAKICFAIYDIFPLTRPELFSSEDNWFDGEDFVTQFRRWLISICGVSDILIGVSKATVRDTKQWISENKSEILHTPLLDTFRLGASRIAEAKHEVRTDVVNIFGADPTFLMVGTLEPRKGHALVLDAFEILWKMGKPFQLVIVGRLGWRSDELLHRINQHQHLGSHLFFLQAAADQDLACCYQNADALLSMSEAEGFGLPNIEAAKFELPIVARDLPVFREVCGAGAYYVAENADATIHCQ